MTEIVRVVVPPEIVHLVKPRPLPQILKVVSAGAQGVPGVQGNPGAAGPKGDSPARSVYDAASTQSVSGWLTLDLSSATTFLVAMDENITDVVLMNEPDPDQSQRIAIYLAQDAVGSRSITGWPQGTRWPQGVEPFLTTAPNAVDLVVLDVVDGMIFGALVASDYR